MMQNKIWYFLALSLCVSALSAQNDSFSQRMKDRVKVYKPLTKTSIAVDSFFLPDQSSNVCKAWLSYRVVTTYTDKGIITQKLPTDLIPKFDVTPFDEQLGEKMIRPITDSLTFIEDDATNGLLLKSTISLFNKQTSAKETIKLNTYEQNNDKVIGLYSDPIEALNGAFIVLNYNFGDADDKPILIDDSQPIVYERELGSEKSIHSFLFSLKDNKTFRDIKSGMFDLTVYPPQKQDILHLTKSDVGKVISYGGTPVLVLAFEHGIVHLAYHKDSDVNFSSFYSLKNGVYMNATPQGTMINYDAYDVFRDSAMMKPKQFCAFSEKITENQRVKSLMKAMPKEDVDYNIMILQTKCDADEIYLCNEYDGKPLGASFVVFTYDSNTGYSYTAMQRMPDGTIKLLEEVTKPEYKSLHESINKNLQYEAPSEEVEVVVQATISKEGQMYDIKLYSEKGNPIFDAEALRVVKLLDKPWIPAKIQDNPVDMNVLIPVWFKPNKK